MAGIHLERNLHAQDGSVKDLVANVLEHLRAFHATLSAVMVDVAALRRCTLEGPEDLRRYKRCLDEGMQEARPLVRGAMRSYDELLRSLKVERRREQ